MADPISELLDALMRTKAQAVAGPQTGQNPGVSNNIPGMADLEAQADILRSTQAETVVKRAVTATTLNSTDGRDRVDTGISFGFKNSGTVDVTCRVNKTAPNAIESAEEFTLKPGEPYNGVVFTVRAWVSSTAGELTFFKTGESGSKAVNIPSGAFGDLGTKTDTPATIADATAFSLIAISKAILKSTGASFTDENGNVLTIKRAKWSIAASATDTAIVAAVTAKKLRVLSYTEQVDGSGPTTMTWNSKPAGAGSAISGAHPNAANLGRVCGHNVGGWFQSNSGEGLSGTTGTGGTTTGEVTYVEVP